MKLRGMLAVVVGLLVMSMRSYGQGMNSWWVFPNNNALHFVGNTMIVDTSSCIAPFLDTGFSFNTISDNQGNLLFYNGHQILPPSYNQGELYNKNGQMVENGDSIRMCVEATLQNFVMIPSPADTNQIICLAIQHIQAPFQDFNYSIIDRSYNNGLGKVIIKNQTILADSFANFMAVTKHANGRDWWVLLHPYRYLGSDEILEYLIDPFGINLVQTFHFGPAFNHTGGIKSMDGKFNLQGNQFLLTMGIGFAGLYDFDRCNGMLSNEIDITPINHYQKYFGPFFCEFSPSGNVAYLANSDSIWAVNIGVDFTQTLVHTYNGFPQEEFIMSLQGGPNGKIYFNDWAISDSNALKYISVINYPDIFGNGCNIQYQGIFLGGKKLHYTLPYEPNYSLGPLAGSPCDTLTGTHTIPKPNYNLSIAPNPASGSTTVFYNLSSGQEAVLRIYNNLGQLIETTKLHKGSNHYEIDISHYTAGLYYALIGNGEWNEGRKFVVAP